MAPVRGPRLVLCCALFASLAAAPAHALRIVDYNITNYGSNGSFNFPARQPYFRTIFSPLNADIVVVQEMRSAAGVDSFRNNVLNVIEPGQWASAPYLTGGDTNNALFYKPARVTVVGAWAFYPDPGYLLRVDTVWRLRPVGYGSDAAEFRIYSQHAKASQGSACTSSGPGLPCETDRLNESIGLRDSMNAMPPGTHAMAVGDWNFYNSSTEPGYGKLLESQANNIGQLLDPLNPTDAVQNWHNNAAFVNIHTQCPCVTCPSGSGFSGGGLDDRFDQILPTVNFFDGQGLDVVPGSNVAIGQDGQHFNKNITDAPTIPEGATYATALWNASDHLPSRIDIQVPAKVAASTSPIALGTVIVGASGISQNLAVSNPAVAPADTLDYSYATPAGFTAPGGTLHILVGNSANDAIGLDTSTPGNFSGNLHLNSNDVDTPSLAIALTGTVLAHASASLDSSAIVLSDSLDFGVQPAGSFSDQLARVHDFGYDALHARLAVSGAAITGPDAARFSIVGGFSPALVGVPAGGWNVHFDDSGTTAGDTYTATLTFSSSDEALPGAAAQPAVAYTLVAEVASGATAVGDGGLPTVTHLYAPFPNPLRGTSTVRFDLARAADLALDVFDLSGRRVAKLADGAFPAGRWSVRWDGLLSSGRTAGAGLYFVRMSDGGRPLATARLAIVK